MPLLVRCVINLWLINRVPTSLKKYLNIQDCLEKSLKIKFALKSTGKSLKSLESP